jgi:hypothetical protein
MSAKDDRPTLAYLPPAKPPDDISATVLFLVVWPMGLLLTVVHAFYCMITAYALSYYFHWDVGSPFLWTSLAWIWAALPSPGGGLLDFAASLVSGTVLASVVVRSFSKVRPIFGRHYWRLWVLLGGWLFWFPVPAKLAFFYYLY